VKLNSDSLRRGRRSDSLRRGRPLLPSGFVGYSGLKKNYKIKLITKIKGFTLIVFYTPKGLWQFSYLDRFGQPTDYNINFATGGEAENVGRSWIDLIAKQNL